MMGKKKMMMGGGKAGGKMSMAQVNAFLKSKGMKAVKA